MGRLTQNAVIDCALLAWFLAQMGKILLTLLFERRLDMRKLTASGGMPSSHSACVVACTTSIGKLYGFTGPMFGLAAVFSAVVMYDACNVRRSAGDTARLVNQLLAHVERLTAEDFADDLKIIMGHTPLQVFAGAVLGLLIGLLA